MKFNRMILIFHKGKCARITKAILKRNYRARAHQKHLLENKVVFIETICCWCRNR